VQARPNLQFSNHFLILRSLLFSLADLLLSAFISWLSSCLLVFIKSRLYDAPKFHVTHVRQWFPQQNFHFVQILLIFLMNQLSNQQYFWFVSMRSKCQIVSVLIFLPQKNVFLPQNEIPSKILIFDTNRHIWSGLPCKDRCISHFPIRKTSLCSCSNQKRAPVKAYWHFYRCSFPSVLKWSCHQSLNKANYSKSSSTIFH